MLRAMAERVLPTGTITFLFSDMVGSTRLVSDLGPATFRDVLDRHNEVLRAAFAAHGGTERGTQGDSFLVMFREAPEALAAAADAQRALAGVAWPRDADVRVRMGVHTGVGMLGGDDYVGLDVHRAARIAAAAHGGQVLVSEATRALVERALPPGIALASLGEHTLRDIGQPERLYQLVIDGLPSAFPPPRTMAGAGGRLPERVTSFIGRDRELDELGRLLASNRLLTLTGPGGTGKSSLALELARRHAPDHASAAWWVPLDTVPDPALVEPAMAAALGLIEAPGQSVEVQLVGFLAERTVLLVLDNFEHVLAAAPLVGNLLRAAPGLRIVVTSRAPLHLAAEQEYPVPPLSLPGPVAPAATALASPAVRLFVDRARRVRPAYELTDADAVAVADICRRLDGLPLGIELAASRMTLLPAAAIAERLARRLDLPGPERRDAPRRQQSLEGAIDWSYHLLEPPTRRLLARMSVFAGGARLDEIDAVTGPADELGIDVLDGLSTLVDQSLVQPEPGPDGPRFRLLETIRMFAAARLADLGGEDEIRRLHARAYLDLAQAAAPHMTSPGQAAWLDRLAADVDNLRLAVRFAIETGDAETGLRLGAALWRFWQLRGHVHEGRALVEAVLALPGADAAGRARVRALDAAGGLAWWSADPTSAHALYLEQLAAARTLQDARGEADALCNLIHTTTFLGPEAGDVTRLRREAIEACRALGDERSIARLDWTVAQRLARDGQTSAGRAAMLALVSRFRVLGDSFYLALAAGGAGWLAFAEGDVEDAIRWSMQALEQHLALTDLASTLIVIRDLALFLLADGMVAEATTVFATYQAVCRRRAYQPPFYPERILARWPVTTEELEAGLTRPEYAAEAERGAAMTIEAAAALVAQALARRSTAPHGGPRAARPVAAAAPVASPGAPPGAPPADDEPAAGARRLLDEAQRLFRAGELRSSGQVAVRAGELARRAHRADLLGEAALVVTGVEDHVLDTAIDGMCRDALAALDPGEIALRGRLHGQLAVALFHRDHLDEAAIHSERALELAGLADDPSTTAAALHARQMVIQGLAHPDEAAELGARMIALASVTRSVEQEMLGRLWRIDALLQLGDTARTEGEIDALDALAARTEERLVRWHALRARAGLAQGLGRFAGAERLAREARDVLSPSEHGMGEPLFRAQLTLIHLDRGIRPGELDMLQEAGAGGPPIARAVVGWLELQLGLVDEARASLEAIRPRLAGMPLREPAIPTLAAGIELAVAFDDLQLAGELRDRLGPLDGTMIAGAQGTVGPTAYFLARAEQALGRLDEAIAHYEAGIALAGPGDFGPALTRARVALAEALAQRAARGDRQRAAALASIAVVDARRLGLLALLPRATTLARGLSRSPGRLSPRERGIARHIAAGRSNRDIAEALVLSERTVETHVQNVLTKLDFHSRAQVAAWAVGEGLAGPGT